MFIVSFWNGYAKLGLLFGSGSFSPAAPETRIAAASSIAGSLIAMRRHVPSVTGEDTPLQGAKEKDCAAHMMPHNLMRNEG
jgi:hypothetical protein